MNQVFCLWVHYGSPSTLRVVNLLYSCKSSGGAETLFVAPGIIRVHPSPSLEVSLTLIVGLDTACFPTADGSLGSLRCWVSETILSISLSALPVLHSLLPSSHNSSTRQHSSSKTGHLLQERGASLLASETMRMASNSTQYPRLDPEPLSQPLAQPLRLSWYRSLPTCLLVQLKVC